MRMDYSHRQALNDYIGDDGERLCAIARLCGTAVNPDVTTQLSLRINQIITAVKTAKPVNPQVVKNLIAYMITNDIAPGGKNA